MDTNIQADRKIGKRANRQRVIQAAGKETCIPASRQVYWQAVICACKHRFI